MSATSGGSPSKARFEILEGPNAGVFEVQYNPKEFKAERGIRWEEHEDAGQTQGYLEFQKGTSMAVTMDLIFDTTSETGGAADVRSSWVNGLLVMTNADCQPASGEAKNQKKQRPPKVLFTWGSFQMTCVVESVNTTYLLFASDGTPQRARCSVKLKEWKDADYEGASGGSRWEGNAIQLVEARAGDTASSVAGRSGSDWRAVAEDNDIDDPMAEIDAGTELVIRSV